MIDRAEQLRQREEALHTPKDRGRQTDAQWIALHKRAAELADAVLAHPAALALLQDQINQLEQDLSDMRDTAERAYRRGYLARVNGE